MILMQNYFKTMPNSSRSILEAFLIDYKHFIFFSHFHHFLTLRTSTSVRVKPHLKVYRGANPLACALALMCLRHTKSQKYMFLRKKFNFSQKPSSNLRKSPCDPGSPGTSISYYSKPAVNRQPDYRREDREVVVTKTFQKDVRQA